MLLSSGSIELVSSLSVLESEPAFRGPRFGSSRIATSESAYSLRIATLEYIAILESA